MNESETIEKIAARLKAIREADPAYSLFGTASHRYRLNPTLRESEIAEFESRFNIKLPEGYRCFLSELGNGGAGPYYGLQTLSDSLYENLVYKREGQLMDPATPFPLTGPWNMKYEGDVDNHEAHMAFEDEYFDSRWSTGLLRICNYGCGASLNLVVNGPEYGRMWMDSRGGDGGICPDPCLAQNSRVVFLEWYQLWLAECEDKLKIR